MKGTEGNALASFLDASLKRHREIEASLQNSAVASNQTQSTALMKERRRILKIVEPARRWESANALLREAEAILADPASDAEIREIAKSDAAEAQIRSQAAMEEINEVLLIQDGFAERDVVMEIRAGTGGDEAGLFAADLFRMYQKYAEAQGWRIEILDDSSTDLGGLKEIVFSIEGEGVFHKLRFESGGHRVQRVPETETQGRIHTSACTVAVLPEPEEVEIVIKPEDLRVDTCRAGGPGGQKVNKTSSAVRLTHIPTGIVVHCQDDKSQHKNRSKAMKILRTRLFDMEQAKQQAERSEMRRSQIGSGDRSERIRTYNFPQNRITDHRIHRNFTLLTAIDGDIGDLIDALIQAYKTERLAEIQKNGANLG